MFVTFSKRYCVVCKKWTLKVQINPSFVTPFEESHYILLFRYIYGAQIVQWFWYSKSLHVNRRSHQGSKWRYRTSSNRHQEIRTVVLMLHYCSSATADFEIKHFFNPIRLETRRNGRVALVSLAGLAKAARVRHLGMQRGGGRRDSKLSG